MRLPRTERADTGPRTPCRYATAPPHSPAPGRLLRDRGVLLQPPPCGAHPSLEPERPDLYAVLDVTYPEPPVEGSPLYTMPNIVLTPHIAGSLSTECRRMGQYAINELKRYLNGEPQQWAISREQAATLA